MVLALFELAVILPDMVASALVLRSTAMVLLAGVSHLALIALSNIQLFRDLELPSRASEKNAEARMLRFYELVVAIVPVWGTLLGIGLRSRVDKHTR